MIQRAPNRPNAALWIGVSLFLLAVLVTAFTTDLQEKINSDIYSDLYRYQVAFGQIGQSGLINYIATMRYEPLYLGSTWVFNWLDLPLTSFVFFVKICLAWAYYAFCLHLNRRPIVSMFVAAALVMSPLFASFTENIIRQGSAFAVFLYFCILWIEGRRAAALVLSLVAVSLHLSAIVWIGAMIAALPIARRFKFSTLLGFQILILIVYMTNVMVGLTPYLSYILSLVGSDYYRYAEFGAATPPSYNVGFKISFFLASCALLTGFVLNRSRGNWSSSLAQLFVFSLVMTFLYVCASGVPFYDRIATPAWALIPAVWGGLLLRPWTRHPALRSFERFPVPRTVRS
ncbi:EpsG family protein [Kaistia terrae]|uniref:EpsG family protein n=1 Tax=Kaistia terrae TaxID=537017 RepID=A0ABW0PUN8_9HYPH|nr:EpsG family protein [Kaistia terrae]MCX5576721.1 EpsG family protein [Kaistia terrae]